jgi:hypothetical protein
MTWACEESSKPRFSDTGKFTRSFGANFAQDAAQIMTTRLRSIVFLELIVLIVFMLSLYDGRRRIAYTPDNYPSLQSRRHS